MLLLGDVHACFSLSMSGCKLRRAGKVRRIGLIFHTLAFSRTIKYTQKVSIDISQSIKRKREGSLFSRSMVWL
jgi:hypothetical protein